MPLFPIVDTHLHLWDPERIAYAWQKGSRLLNHCYDVEQYQHDSRLLDVESMVFVECHADAGQYIQELEFVEQEVRRDPRIRALVAKAPLEHGTEVAVLLDEMCARFPRLRGIRRIPEFERDPRSFMLHPNFIEGVRLLKRFDLHFELNVNYTQMDAALEFLDQVRDVRIVLDHCGKPGIKGGHVDRFRRHIKAAAAYPNVVCKLSDLTVEANWERWTEADLHPFIEATLEAFGIERVLYGGDWPVCLQATTLDRWIEVLDSALTGLSLYEMNQFYRDNANRFYRI